jgi:hypothetical protein
MPLDLRHYLAELAGNPDRLTEFVSSPEAAFSKSGLADRDRRALLSGNQQQIYEAITSGAAPSKGGAPEPAEANFDANLIIVGTGIRTVGQVTMEAIAWMRRADKVLYVVADPVAEELIHTLNPQGAESLAHLYAENKLRAETYKQMIAIMLKHVRSGKRVCFAAYGHPGVFVYPTHEAIRRARAEGFKARMLPAISAEACLLADLGIDMLAGAQSFEATDFLLNVRYLDPFSHIMLWQIGGLGDPTFKRYQFEIRGLPELVGKLLRYYSPWHTAYLYEAPLYPGVEPSIRPGPLGYLPYTKISPSATLYIPPIGPPSTDRPIAQQLRMA